MNTETQVETLRSALLARARQLAREIIAHGENEARRIVEEARERLAERQRREARAAEALAERRYRQRVQAAEIRLRAELDQIQWAQVQVVMDQLRRHLAQWARQDAGYTEVVQTWLREAVSAIPADRLVARCNAADHKRFAAQWKSWSQAAASGKAIVLADEAIECSGGVLVHDAEDTIRIDNTIEGRIARFEPLLQQRITEVLFGTAHVGAPTAQVG